ncbi:hypothetical protein L3Y34_019581 [Caenorhabditis briggsae]|uniref:RING-type domain-containing protein n=1 Tax=Caenorhabditis briggsae TaxID=6238 RepID=A0AAE9DQ71_CAEBR|nr:hypothetical protein L3Y34_019581 [Caenorhabditis briggsae]
MIYAKKYYGVTENHFGLDWRICLYREKGQFFFGLECLTTQNLQNWSLNSFIESNLKSSSGIIKNLKVERFSESGNCWKSTKFNQLKKLVPDEILFVEFSVKLSKNMENPNNLDSNIFLIVGNNRFPICKKFLLSQSSHFRSTIPDNDKKIIEILLSNIKIEDFIEFQDVLHGRIQISDQNVNPVLEIAKKYSFEFVLKKCKNFLTKNSNFSTVEKMKLAREFDLEELKDHLKSLDESENCAISTDSLKCTVCYEIFPGAPMIVQCGHSFCISCVENLKKSSSAYCPICRKYVNFSNAVPNFTLKNVLDSLEELGKNEKRPFENTKNITIERLQEQNSQLEREKETAEDDLRFAETFIDEYWSQIQHLKAQSVQRNSTARKYKFLFIGVCGLLVILIYQYHQLELSITKHKCWFF